MQHTSNDKNNNNSNGQEVESKKEQTISPTATPAGSDNRYETCSRCNTAYPHDV